MTRGHECGDRGRHAGSASSRAVGGPAGSKGQGVRPDARGAERHGLAGIGRTLGLIPRFLSSYDVVRLKF